VPFAGRCALMAICSASTTSLASQSESDSTTTQPLLRAFREGLERRALDFANEIETRQPKLPTAAVRGASLRILTNRLFEWAQQKVAETPTTTSKAEKVPNTATLEVDP
jgi:hypothetical protein